MTERKTETERQRGRETKRHRERQKQRDGEAERQRDKETETERESINNNNFLRFSILWEMFHIIGMNLALALFGGDISMVLSELASIRSG